MSCDLVERNVNFYLGSGRRRVLDDSYLLGLRDLRAYILDLSSYANKAGQSLLWQFAVDERYIEYVLDKLEEPVGDLILLVLPALRPRVGYSLSLTEGGLNILSAVVFDPEGDICEYKIRDGANMKIGSIDRNPKETRKIIDELVGLYARYKT